MHILDLPSIPREKKALQAIINDARHKAFIQRWLRRGIALLVVVNVWGFGCYEPRAPRAEGAEQAQEQGHAGTTEHVHEQAQQGVQVALPLITR
jgi:hypothetical protein